MVPLSQRLSLPLIPYHDWLELLRGHTTSSDSTDLIYSNGKVVVGDGGHRSHQLLEFFEGLFERVACGSLALGMENTGRVSNTLATVEAVGPELLERYVGFWRACGLLSVTGETGLR
jgi:hypothetical protein